MKRSRIFSWCADRKGAAMELAIMVIVVTLSLSIMLVTTSLLQHSRRQSTTETMERTVLLEHIGERFCNDSANGNPIDWTDQYTDYRIEYDHSNTTLTVYDADTGERLLLVQLNGRTIVKWDKK